MKVQYACLALAALSAVTAGSADAADWGNGASSIKDAGMGAAVPIPAPVPIPEYKPSWYFRMDAGYGTVSQPSISESGYTYGGIVNSRNGYSGTFANGPDLQVLDPSWFSSDFSRMATFGAGVGYYLGGGWRIDATVEKRSNDQAGIQGSESWDSHSYYDTDFDGVNDTYGTDPNANGIVDRRSTLTVSDKTDVDGTVWMANAYYDLTSHGRRGFTPYIGAGIGFVWNELDRTHTSTLVSCDNEVPCAATVTEETRTGSTRANKVSIAAAVMAGLSYQISDITSVDVGYRYLFLGGTDFAMDIAGVESRVTIGDQHIHQVRAGLRFDVN
jgi:opacity protein-like surface antigen